MGGTTQIFGGSTACVLTIIFAFITYICVSYISEIFSENLKTKKYNFSDFHGIRYTRSMGILDNLENSEFAWDKEWDNGKELPFIWRQSCLPLYDTDEKFFRSIQNH